MSKIAEQVETLVKPIVEGAGFEIVEVEFAKKYNGDNLTIFIDKPGGVTINDCEKVHNLVDSPLDELDPTAGKPYTLNVSSPGVDRPIVTDKDFTRNIGETLEVKLFEPVFKKKTHVGELVAFNSSSIILDCNGENLEIERNKISKATKYINF